MALLSSAVSALNGVTDRRQALLFQGAARIGRLVIQLGSRADQEAAPRRPLKTREERKTRRKPAES
jgi:hypothetical protein